MPGQPLTPSESALLLRDGQFIVTYIPVVICQSMVWGMYLLIMSFLTYILVNKGIRRSRRRIIMLSLTWFMFGVATGIFFLNIYAMMFQVKGVNFEPTLEGQSVDDKLAIALVTYSYTQVSIVKRALFAILVVLGDGVVLWRTWALWNGDIRAMILPICCYLSVIGTRIGITIEDTKDTRAGFHTITLEVVSVVISCVTNCVCTAMIGYKAWQYRRVMKLAYGSQMPPSTTHLTRLLTFFIESGILYIVLFSIQAIAYSPGARTRTYGSLAIIARAIDGIVGQMIGVYPTVIILVVGLQRSILDYYSPHSTKTTALRFAPQGGNTLDTDTTSASARGIYANSPDDSDGRKQELTDVV